MLTIPGKECPGLFRGLLQQHLDQMTRGPLRENSLSGGTKLWKGLDSSVSVVPGCNRLTVANGQRRRHSMLRQRSS